MQCCKLGDWGLSRPFTNDARLRQIGVGFAAGVSRTTHLPPKTDFQTKFHCSASYPPKHYLIGNAFQASATEYFPKTRHYGVHFHLVVGVGAGAGGDSASATSNIVHFADEIVIAAAADYSSAIAESFTINGAARVVIDSTIARLACC